jgi:RND family efflux transporter MFP subunit
MTNKRDLLEQLRIPRDEAPQQNAPRWTHVVIGWLLTAVVFWLLGRYGQKPEALPGQADTGPTVSQSPAAAPAASTRQVPATEQAVPASVLTASGYVTPRRWATVSGKVMGQLTDVLVEEGMTVREGQVLAHIDDEVARQNLAFARARAEAARKTLASLSARIEDAEKQVARLERLQEQDLGNESQLSTARATLKDLRAQLDAERAQVRAADIETRRQAIILDQYTVRAPFDGVVTMKNAQPGEIIAPGSAGGGFTRTGICTLVDMSSLEIEVDVNEAFIGRVKPGQKVQATLDAYPEWKIPARVVAIIPAADRSKATVRVRIGFDQLDPRILPDMGVSVSFLSNDS